VEYTYGPNYFNPLFVSVIFFYIPVVISLFYLFGSIMAMAALENSEFPYKNLNPDDAARKIFRKLSRNVCDNLLVDLDEHWFFFKRRLLNHLTDFPKFILKALCRSPPTNEDIKTLAAFSYINNIDPSLITDILQLKNETAEEQFHMCLTDFDDNVEGDIIRNVTVTYSLLLGYRVNLNNEPIWLVSFDQDKENVPPRN